MDKNVPAGVRGESVRGIASAHRPVRLTGVPTFSVVIASKEARRELEAHLHALLPQCQGLDAEIVVARAGEGLELQSLRSNYPTVRFLSLPRGTSAAELRAAGMAEADGDIVTFLDDSATVTPTRFAHLAGWHSALNATGTTATATVSNGTGAAATATTPAGPVRTGGGGGKPPEATGKRRFDRLKEGDRVVIIGAGPGGLTPAYLLAKRGVKVTVLEADDVVGGISRTAQYKGYRFDIGGHRFFTKIKPVEDLWKELLGDEFISVPRLSRIHYQGKFFDYPLKAMNALRGLGIWNAILMVVSYVWAHLRPSPVEENLEQWVTNRFGKRLYQIFFKTYTEKVWGIPCTEIRAEWAAQRIQNLSLAKAILSAAAMNKRSTDVKSLINEFQYPRLGPGQMWEICHDKVIALGGEVLMQHKVESIEMENGRVVAVRAKTPDGEVRIAGDHFISTMPVKNLVHALEPVPPAVARAAANGLGYRDFLTVALMLDKDDIFPDNWIYIHTPGVKVGRIQNFNNWSRAMVPVAGQTCLGMEYFCFEGDGLWTSPDADLIAQAARELRELGLDQGANVVDGTVVRMPKAYPVYDSTYREHLDTVREFIDPIPNLHLVGRNGMHKYNNQDHSMYTAMLTIANMDGANHDVWAVNTDFEYHEEIRVEETPPSDAAALAPAS